MKKFLIFIAIACTICVLGFAGLYMFINIKGKDLIIAAVQKNTGVAITIDTVTLEFPLIVKIFNIKAGDVSARKIKFGISPLFNLFKPALFVNNLEIDGVDAKISRDSSGIYCEPFIGKNKSMDSTRGLTRKFSAQTSKFNQNKSVSKSFSIPIMINRFILKNAKIEFIDNSLPGLVPIMINNVCVNMRGLSIPYLTKFFINASAVIQPRNKNAAVFKTDGWVDYSRKNMNVTLVITDIDYQSFEQYCPKNWKLADIGAAKALLSFTSKMISNNDNLEIDSRLNVDSIEFIPDEASNDKRIVIFQSKKQMVKTILALAQGKNDKPSLPFKQKTKMSAPKLDFSSLLEYFYNSIKVDPITILQNIFNSTVKIINNKTVDRQNSAVESNSGQDSLAGMSKQEKKQQRANDIISGIFSIIEQSQSGSKKSVSTNQ